MKKRPLINMLTSLENIPKEWLNHVEPKVVRGAFLPCWIWAGAVDKNGYPIMRDGNTIIMMHRYVAKLFYKVGKTDYVKRSCGINNCVNPNHVYVSKTQRG